MNRREKQTSKGFRTPARGRPTVMIWTAAIALVAVILLIVGLSNSAPSNFFKKAVVVVAILLLALRQLSRRWKGSGSKAADPDPQSRLHLD